MQRHELSATYMSYCNRTAAVRFTALTTQQRMPIMWNLFRLLCRKVTAKRAANNISAPLIIWYTEAVTESSPMFISTVAMRSNKVGMASMKMSLVLFPRITAVSFVSLSCTQQYVYVKISVSCSMTTRKVPGYSVISDYMLRCIHQTSCIAFLDQLNSPCFLHTEGGL